jgi:hypothetical protein
MVIFQLHSLPLRPHDLVTPRQYPRPRRLGTESPSRVAHSVFLPPQRPFHRSVYPSRRNRHKQSNDPPTKLLLQKYNLYPIHHSLHLRHPLRCYVCISTALLDKSGCRLARLDSFQ